jgi:hypothetical protein
MPVFAEAIRLKGSPYPRCWCFIDGTFRSFCRPYRDGYNGDAQRAHFAGHKNLHGNNYQGVTTPDGIIIEMHGPYSGRTNDITMLKKSRLLSKFLRFCVYRGVRYYAYGDRGYPNDNPFLMAGFKGRNISDKERQCNRIMSKLRIAVEWSFGKVVNLFAFVDFKKNQKLHLQPVASYWQIAALLANCNSCLYGNHTSRYFKCPTPKLEEYLAGAFR